MIILRQEIIKQLADTKVVFEASAVEGLTIFWKKTDDPSFTGGYY